MARESSIDYALSNGARTYAPWSESGYGRTGTHQPDSEPVVTVALPGTDPAIEGEHALLHIVVHAAGCSATISTRS